MTELKIINKFQEFEYPTIVIAFLPVTALGTLYVLLHCQKCIVWPYFRKSMKAYYPTAFTP
jgi:hypothetical protein